MGKKIPTDEEILKYINVPPEVAALYIGWSAGAVRAALRAGSVPFGAASAPNNKSYTYNIMSEALVKYRHGDLPAYNPRELQLRMLDGLNDVIAEKLTGLNKVLGMLLSA